MDAKFSPALWDIEQLRHLCKSHPKIIVEAIKERQIKGSHLAPEICAKEPWKKRMRKSMGNTFFIEWQA